MLKCECIFTFTLCQTVFVPRRKAPDPFARLRENPPQQARSRATLARLLDATEELLEEGGLDAATVPAIAARAGVSVGVVYRRFPDKDNLLRAVYQRFFDRTRQTNLTGVATIGQSKLPLSKLLPAIIHGALIGNRVNRGLVRALILYSRTHRDPSFRKAAFEMNNETLRAISSVLLKRSDEINHPVPERAIEFALVTLRAVIYTTVIEDPLYKLSNPDAMEAELTRLILSYLGIDGEEPGEAMDVSSRRRRQPRNLRAGLGLRREPLPRGRRRARVRVEGERVRLLPH